MTENSLWKDLITSFNDHPDHGIFEKLENSRILITGGTGFIGCWLMETLLWMESNGVDFEATFTTRSPESFKKKWPALSDRVASSGRIRLSTEDVTERMRLSQSFTYILHGASLSNASHENPRQVYFTSVDGTRNILDFALEKNPKKFLYLSSGAVYGKDFPLKIREENPFYGCKEFHPYAEGKRAAEFLCQEASSFFPVCIARLFSFIGPYMPLKQHYLMGEVMDKLLKNEDYFHLINPNVWRSYMYASDLMVWLFKLLVSGEGIYNVGSNQPFTLKQIVANRFRTISIEHGNFYDDPYVPNTDQAFRDHDLKFTFTLDEAIERTKEWYGSQM